jgi:hypothetical protein
MFSTEAKGVIDKSWTGKLSGIFSKRKRRGKKETGN